MPHLLRRFVGPAFAALVLCVAVAAPAAAHHGWEHFEIAQPVYLPGTVTDVRWGNPHPEVRVTVGAPVALPDGLAERSIPPELEEIGGRTVLQHTRPYDGTEQEVTLILAPIERLAAWDMPDPPVVGEQIEAVGYLSRDESGELRPELVFREDGRAVRQRSVPLPDSPSPAPGYESTRPGGGAAAAAPPPEDRTVTATLWVLGSLGAIVVVGGVVSAAYAARRRSER